MDYCIDYSTYYVEKKNVIDLTKCMNYDERKINKKLVIDWDKLDYTAPDLVSNPIIDEQRNDTDNVKLKNC